MSISKSPLTRVPSRATRRPRRTARSNGQDTPTQADIATNMIRESILDLSMGPGIRLDDKVLLRRFKVGRTPAREAMNRLASEGLVEIQPNRGAFVLPLDIPLLQQFFDAYAASERLNGFFCQTQEPGLITDIERLQLNYEATVAARQWLDTTRVNAALHLRIAEATRNRYIADLAARLHNQARRVSFFIYRMEAEDGQALDEHQRRINVDHHDIVSALRRNDNAALVEVLTRHVQLFHARIMRVLGATKGVNAPDPVRFGSAALRDARF